MPITWRQFERLDIVQRKMLRAVVGWAGFGKPGESWEDRGRLMKHRVEKERERERALATYPVEPWSTILENRKQHLHQNVSALPLFTQAALLWNASETAALNHQTFARRSQGCPRTRW